MLKAGTAARRRTLSWETAQPAADVRQQIEVLLHSIDTLLQQQNADWVGHVKILISSGAETSYGSVTSSGDTPRWSGTLSAPVSRAELTIYAAIYSLIDAQVAAAVDQSLAAADLAIA
jgi:hypothetical protein